METIKDKDGKVIAEIAKNDDEVLWKQQVDGLKKVISDLEKQLKVSRVMLLASEKKLKEVSR